MVDQRALAAHVALEHRPDLRHGDVRLVDDEQEVLGEVVDQRVRGGALGAAVDVPRVVLDARARPDLAHHLDVVGGAHAQALRLEQLALLLELVQPVAELVLDAGDRPLHPLRAGDVVGGREDVHLLLVAHHLAGQRVERVELVDLVAEELDPQRELLVHRDDLDGVAAHAERAAGEGQVVAGVLHADELAQQLVALDDLADAQLRHPVDVLCGVPRPCRRGPGRRVRLARPVGPLLEVLDPAVGGEPQQPQVGVLLLLRLRGSAPAPGRPRWDRRPPPPRADISNLDAGLLGPEAADRVVPDLVRLVRRRAGTARRR